MAPDIEHQCAACGETTTLKCSRCKIAHYCSSTCQKTHWRDHKKNCNSKTLQRVILRAGTLLQKIFFLYREIAFTEVVDALEDTGDQLIIKHSDAREHVFNTFPVHLAKDEEVRQFLLTASRCIEFVGHFPGILQNILKGTGAMIEEVIVQLKQPHKAANYLFGETTMSGGHVSHHLFRVTSPDNSDQWFLDASGPQFLISSPCVKAELYLAKYGERIKRRLPLGTADILSQTIASTRGPRANEQKLKWGCIRAIDVAFEKWKAQSGLEMPSLLDQPEDEYRMNEKDLLDTVSESLRTFVRLNSCSFYQGLGFAARVKESQTMTHVLEDHERTTRKYDV